jgi:MFS family permease
MSQNNQASAPEAPKFGGMEVPPELTKMNFFFLFFCTFIMGMFMSLPAIIQPAFLSDVIKIDPAFTGSVNGLLQNMSQIATLLFVAAIGALSDKTGRRILAFIGFLILVISYYCFGISNGIAEALNIPSGFAATICSIVSFMPDKAAEFAPFAPGLLVTYIMRFIVGIGLILGYPQFITMVADFTYEKDRGKGMAANGMAMGFASILVFGLFGAIVKKMGVVAGINAGAILAATGAVFTWFFLKDRMPEKTKEKTGLKEAIPVVKKSISLKASYMCSLITRADIIVLATFLVSWGVKVAGDFDLTSTEATMKSMFPMIAMGVFSLFAFPVIGILLDKWGRVPTLLLSLICAAVGMLLISVSPNPFSPILYVAVLLAGIGMAGSIAGANTLATDASPKNMIGSILGGLNTMQPIGALFFIAAGGFLFDKMGPGWAFGLKGVANLVLFIWVFMVKGAINAERENK